MSSQSFDDTGKSKKFDAKTLNDCIRCVAFRAYNLQSLDLSPCKFQSSDPCDDELMWLETLTDNINKLPQLQSINLAIQSPSPLKISSDSMYVNVCQS